MNNKARHVFVTRYALSAGVTRCKVLTTYFTGSVRVEGIEHAILYPGRDFQDTEVEALAAAEKMRTEKLASLKRQVGALEATVFTVKEPK